MHAAPFAHNDIDKSRLRVQIARKIENGQKFIMMGDPLEILRVATDETLPDETIVDADDAIRATMPGHYFPPARLQEVRASVTNEFARNGRLGLVDHLRGL